MTKSWCTQRVVLQFGCCTFLGAIRIVEFLCFGIVGFVEILYSKTSHFRMIWKFYRKIVLMDFYEYPVLKHSAQFFRE